MRPRAAWIASYGPYRRWLQSCETGERHDLAGTVAARWRVIGTPALENEASRIAGDQPHGVDLP